MRKLGRLGRVVLLGGLLACLLPQTASGQGLLLPGAGGAHLSMGGASTAAGVDALGALYWNPATISGLAGSEVVIGGEAILADTHLGSTIPARAFGPLGPATTISGLSRSDSGLALTSGLGLVYKQEESPLTFGLGMATLAGGGVNFPGNPSNPILAPVSPFNNFVLGPQASSIMVVGIMPTVSYQLTDRLAVGVSPILDVCVVIFDPAFFGPATDANGDGLSTFPTGSHSRPFWGGGARAGLTYKLTDCLTAGVSYSSPQWFETWRFNARDEVGRPFAFTTQASLPAIASAGLSFTGIDRLTVNADVRWFDYRTTQLCGEPVRSGGAGWDSIWAAAIGARFQVSERLAVQVGYLYNQNPVEENLALFNTQIPAVIEHTASAGFSFQLNESIGLSLAYVHGFENSLSGSVLQLARTTTTIDTEYEALAFGIHVKFGAAPCKPECACPAEECSSCPASLPH